METLLDAIKVFEGQLDGDYSLISGLRFFDEAPSNVNTRFLGWAVAHGASVVTTNYSQVIEREAALFDARYRHTLQSDDEFPTFVQSVPADACHGVVHHIHGVSSSPQTMGITLPLISTRFPRSFRSILESWFQDQEKLVVFVGYSGSDEYDVNKFFCEYSQSEAWSSRAASGLYLRYGKGAGPTPKERTLLRPFRGQSICTASLTELSAYLSPTPSLPLIQPGKDEGFNWLKAFDREAHWPAALEQRKELGNLFALALSDYFGINLSDCVDLDFRQLSVLRRRLSGKGQWYANYYAIRYAEMSGNGILLQELDKSCDDDLYLKRILHNALGRISEADELYASPHEVKNALSDHLINGEVIDWHDVSAPLNHYVFEFLRTLADGKGLEHIRALIEDHENDLHTILECADLIKELPYDQIVSLRQTATAFRAAGIVRALLGKEYSQALPDVERAESLYDDISSINGLLVSLLAKAVVLGFWCADENVDMVSEAQKAFSKAVRLSEASKDHHSQKKCLMVGRLLESVFSSKQRCPAC